MIRGGIAMRDNLCALLPVISELMAADCMYSVCDTERFLAYRAGATIDVHIRTGDAIPEQSPMMEAMRTGVQSTKIVPEEIWGTPFRSTSTPISDENNRIIGAVGIGISIARERELTQTYRIFAETLEKVVVGIRGISGQLHGHAQENRHFIRLVSQAEETAQQTRKLIEDIDAIATTTNLLSLNAAVEASRAGVHGKGFAVVAQEIRNLSENTKLVTVEIAASLQSLVAAVSALSVKSSGQVDAINEEVVSIGEIEASIMDMQTTAQRFSQQIL